MPREDAHSPIYTTGTQPGLPYDEDAPEYVPPTLPKLPSARAGRRTPPAPDVTPDATPDAPPVA